MNFVPNPLDLQALSEALEKVVSPAFILDPWGGRLLAANRPGRLAWGLPAERRPAPLVLDHAMPALEALRATEEGSPSRTLRLTFWTLRGARTWNCLVRHARSELSKGTLLVSVEGPAAGRPLVPVRPAIPPTPPRELAASPPPAAATPPASQARSRPDAEDEATLREIARRIRAGASEPVATGASAAEMPAPAAEAATSASAASCGPTPNDADAKAAHAGDPPHRDALARLSHELRTPLAAIVSLADVLAEGHLGPLANERQRDYLGSIRNAARHMIGVVDTMLDRDSLASGRPALTFTDVDLNEVVSEVMPALEPLADRSGVALALAFALDMPRVVADRLALRQILINLVSNALRHAGSGARAVVRTGHAPGGEAWLEVEDDGPGISSEVLAEAMDQRTRQGTRGLGLPLSRRLAQATGARLTITGVTPHGTRVRIAFPPSRIVPV